MAVSVGETQELVGHLLLHTCLDYNNKILLKLLKDKGSAVSVLESSDEELVSYLKPETIAKLRSEQFQVDAEKLYNYILQSDIQLLRPQDENYPNMLVHCQDHPSILYARGNANFNSPRTIAVVGTRNPTAYGKRIVERIIGELAPYNPTIVSGLAYGIDVLAHECAMERQLETIAVLGGGLCKVYPAMHQSVAQKITTQGALVSEYGLYAQPKLHYFPMRNRVIAGICQATLVIETKIKGGSMITAYLTLDYNRELFTVPHSIFSERGAGCHDLLKKHMAHIVESGSDIATILGWDEEDNLSKKASLPSMDLLTQEERSIMELLQAEDSVHIDAFSARLQIDSATLSLCLLQLEMQGYIVRTAGDIYQSK